MEWKDIELGGRTSGQVKVKCPNCIESRSDKSDKSLSINIDKGLYMCHYCGIKGARDLKENETIADIHYETPSQDWQNYTTLSDKLVKWFKDVRGISQKTLIDCRITQQKCFFPQKNETLNAIAFNYFDGDKLITSKFRSGDKDFMQTPNTKKIFYGINDISTSDEIIIVEGEIDKLSFWEVGVKNVISVPNGAQDVSLFDRDAEMFEGKKIVIAVDTDKNGKKLETEIIAALGRKNCAKIFFNDGCKDANDVLVKKGSIALYNCYKNKKTFRLIDAEKHVVSSAKINRETRDFLEGKTETGMISGIPILDKHFPFKKKEFYLLTGSKGYGKSTIHQALQLVGSISNDLKFMCSFKENSDWTMDLNIMNYLVGGWSSDFLKDNPKKYAAIEAWVNDHFFYVDVDTIEELLSTATAYIEDKGIDLFAVLADPINSYSIKGTKNSYDIGTNNANDLLRFSMKYATVMISQHPNLSAQRGGDVVSSSDGQGGQYYSKSSMAYVIHRERGTNRNELHIENVRTKATGGDATEPENPIIIEWTPSKINVCYNDGTDRVNDIFKFLIEKHKPFDSYYKKFGVLDDVAPPLHLDIHAELNEAF